MQINNQSYNIKFSGIYRLPNTAENAKALKHYVLPLYNEIKHDKIFIFPGNNPFRLGVDIIIDMVAKSNHSSKEWVKMNAHNHGINITNIGEEVIHIISSDKDVGSFKKYIKTRTSKERFLLKKLNRLLKNRNNKNKSYANIPEHLNIIFAALRRNKEEDKAFSQFAKNAIDVTSPEELLSFILTE